MKRKSCTTFPWKHFKIEITPSDTLWLTLTTSVSHVEDAVWRWNFNLWLSLKIEDAINAIKYHFLVYAGQLT